MGLSEASTAAASRLCVYDVLCAGNISNENIVVPMCCVQQQLRLTSANKLNHLDTTSFTFANAWHVLLVYCEVERVVASRVVPRVALEAINSRTSCRKEKKHAINQPTTLHSK